MDAPDHGSSQSKTINRIVDTADHDASMRIGRLNKHSARYTTIFLTGAHLS